MAVYSRSGQSMSRCDRKVAQRLSPRRVPPTHDDNIILLVVVWAYSLECRMTGTRTEKDIL